MNNTRFAYCFFLISVLFMSGCNARAKSQAEDKVVHVSVNFNSELFSQTDIANIYKDGLIVGSNLFREQRQVSFRRSDFGDRYSDSWKFEFDGTCIQSERLMRRFIEELSQETSTSLYAPITSLQCFEGVIPDQLEPTILPNGNPG